MLCKPCEYKGVEIISGGGDIVWARQVETGVQSNSISEISCKRICRRNK